MFRSSDLLCQVSKHTFPHVTLHKRRADGDFATSCTSPSLALPHSGPSISSCCGHPALQRSYHPAERVSQCVSMCPSEWTHLTSSTFSEVFDVEICRATISTWRLSKLPPHCPCCIASSRGQASFGSAWSMPKVMRSVLIPERLSSASITGFPKMGYPQSSSILDGFFHGFSPINQPATGVPPFVETPMCPSRPLSYSHEPPDTSGLQLTWRILVISCPADAILPDSWHLARPSSMASVRLLTSLGTASKSSSFESSAAIPWLWRFRSRL